MKSLKIIQVLAKVFKIICFVLFILCIVGAAGCFIAMIVVPIVAALPADEGKTVADVMAENGSPVHEVVGRLAVAFISCGTYIFINKINEKLFADELEVGTPFNHEIVSKMRKTAIINLIAAVALCITAGIVVAIISAIYRAHVSYGYELWSSLGFGLFLLVLSLFCDYGACILDGEAKQEKPEEVEAEKVE